MKFLFLFTFEGNIQCAKKGSPSGVREWADGDR